MIEIYEEFEKLTHSDLIERANQCFAEAHHAANNQIMGSHGPAGHLLEAQFYMAEMNRRDEKKIVRRDLILELVIIFLIGLEIIIGIGGIWFAFRDAKEQATAVNKQTIALLEVERSSMAMAETISILVRASQKEYGLTYRVSLNIRCNLVPKSLTVSNVGQRKVTLVRTVPAMFDVGYAILAGQQVNVPAELIFDRLDKHPNSPVEVHFYLRSDDESTWLATYRFRGKKNQYGVLEVSADLVSIKQT